MILYSIHTGSDMILSIIIQRQLSC